MTNRDSNIRIVVGGVVVPIVGGSRRRMVVGGVVGRRKLCRTKSMDWSRELSWRAGGATSAGVGKKNDNRDEAEMVMSAKPSASGIIITDAR